MNLVVQCAPCCLNTYTPTYVSAYPYYMCVLMRVLIQLYYTSILVYMCPHTILVYMCQRDRLERLPCSYYCHTHTTCVLILYYYIRVSGIDLNDCRKTWATLRFYAILLSGLPLISIDEGPVPEGCDPLRHQEALQARLPLSLSLSLSLSLVRSRVPLEGHVFGVCFNRRVLK